MTKQIVLLLLLFTIKYNAYAQCSGQYSGAVYGNTQTTVDIAISDSVTGTFTYYVEYGLPGFTPGTNANPGAGGTVVIKPTNQGNVTLTGLTAATYYNYYIRKMCSPGVWSANTPVKTFFTALNCATATPVTAGTLITNNFPGGIGAWNICTPSTGREIMYSFTPTVTGMHMLFLPPGYQVNYAYRAASGGCSNPGFTCIGYNFANGISQFSFGPITAGTLYYLIADPFSTLPGSSVFRIEAPNCAQPTNITFSNQSAIGFTVNYTGGSGYLEYGPPGFIPGTGAGAGTNGTVYFISNGGSISGLNPGTYYDIYIRSYCGGNNYSANSFRKNVTTYPCPPVSNYGALGSTLNINFFAQYGVYGTTHITGCWPDGYGEERIVKLTPPSAGNYVVSVVSYLSSPKTPPGLIVPLNLALRQADGSCNLNNYFCQQPTYYSPYGISFTMNAPVGGVQYDLLFDAIDSSTYGDFDVTIQCAKPSNAYPLNITATSANIFFDCNCPNPTYLEYGPAGFTPGTGATAGGGTLLSNVTSPVALTNLSVFSNYSVYLRTSCGGSFSDNVAVTFKTLHSCGSEPFLTCGNNFSVNLYQTGGQWSSYNCGTLNANSTEFLYRFTASSTGMHTINNVSGIGYGSTPLNVYYKAAGGSCDAAGWSCAGTLTSSPQTINFGPLTANTTYLILFDGTYANNTKTLNIGCYQCAATITAAGSTTFCLGGSVKLKADTGTGISYQWYKNAAIIPGAVSSVYKVTSSGYYYVVETKPCGQATSGIIAVTANYPPAATITAVGSTTFCKGDSVKLSTTEFSGETCQWKKNGNVIQGATSAVFYAKSSGNYKVTKTNTSGCSATSSVVTVTVNALPAATITPQGPTTFCTGDSVKLAANTGTGFSYQWKKNNTAISGAKSKNYFAKTTGNYKVKITDANGCTKVSPVVTVSVPCREGDNPVNSAFDVSVFPNPANSIFTIKVNGADDYSINFRVFDAMGRLLHPEISKSDDDEFLLGDLKAGIYTLEVVCGKNRKIQRLIKTSN